MASTMIRTLIIDDESRAINLLKTTIERDFASQFQIETAHYPEEGIEKILHYKPELVYLDIEMPLMTGFELLTRIPEIDFKVIFTTAYAHYAIRAIRYNALDYLLKPVNPMELTDAIARFLIQRQKYEDRELYSRQLENLFANNEKNLAITTYDGVVFLELDKIIRCEADLNYTKFILTDNKSFVSSKTLKEYEDLLGSHENFIRVHRSHLVNVDYLVKFKNEGSLVLKDNSCVPISRRRKDDVMKRLHVAAR